MMIGPNPYTGPDYFGPLDLPEEAPVIPDHVDLNNLDFLKAEKRDDTPDFEYRPNYTMSLFHHDTWSLLRAAMSGVGCGKSSGMVMEIPWWASRQAPDRNGIRPTRFAVIRSSYSQLKSTTINTWKEWIPDSQCRIIYDAPIRGLLEFPMSDGTRVESEILFMPLEGDRSVDNLLSLELTGAWVNEAAELRSMDLIVKLMQRLGRYPSKTKRVQCTRKGIILDYNPPPLGSWLHKLFEEEETPENYALYKFPAPLLVEHDPAKPGLENAKFKPNPEAENVEHLDGGYKYWTDMIPTYKSRRAYNDITRFLLGDYPVSSQGRPIFDAFSHHRHVRKHLDFKQRTLMVIGIDGGARCAASFQQFHNGAVHIIDEITSPDNGDALGVGPMLDRYILPRLRTQYLGAHVIFSIDPSGKQPNEQDLGTLEQLFIDRNLTTYFPHTNKFGTRRECGQWFFQRNGVVYVAAKCKHTIRGFGGEYGWKEGTPDEDLVPNKAFHSNICDAAVYGMMYYRYGTDGYYKPETDTMVSGIEEIAHTGQGLRGEQDFFFV